MGERHLNLPNEEPTFPLFLYLPPLCIVMLPLLYLEFYCSDLPKLVEIRCRVDARAVDRLNEDIYHGALRHITVSRRRRHRVGQIGIDLDLLRRQRPNPTERARRPVDLVNLDEIPFPTAEDVKKCADMRLPIGHQHQRARVQRIVSQAGIRNVLEFEHMCYAHEPATVEITTPVFAATVYLATCVKNGAYTPYALSPELWTLVSSLCLSLPPA